jgi:hypothetical protein
MSTFYERHPIVMFLLRFILIAPIVLSIWWYFSPKYAWLLGQMTGTCITHLAGMTIETVRVTTEEASILNTDTTMTMGYEGREYPIQISRFMNNISPFIALVLASPGVAFLRRLKILAAGTAILILGQIIFLVSAFVFAQRIQEAPQIPTAFGLFLMTLPFMLWIVMVYWERLGEYMVDAMPDEEDAASTETQASNEKGNS